MTDITLYCDLCAQCFFVTLAKQYICLFLPLVPLIYWGTLKMDRFFGRWDQFSNLEKLRCSQFLFFFFFFFFSARNFKPRGIWGLDIQKCLEKWFTNGWSSIWKFLVARNILGLICRVYKAILFKFRNIHGSWGH